MRGTTPVTEWRWIEEVVVVGTRAAAELTRAVSGHVKRIDDRRVAESADRPYAGGGAGIPGDRTSSTPGAAGAMMAVHDSQGAVERDEVAGQRRDGSNQRGVAAVSADSDGNPVTAMGEL